MTENEAIARIRYRIKTATDIVGKGIDGKSYEDMEMAINALEEIQQYRASGTVEECREAREMRAPKKPDMANMTTVCSECCTDLKRCYDFCPSCGRAIDWEKKL